MKKTIILIVVLFIPTVLVFCQSFHTSYKTKKNLNRYWYYRERLRDFIWMAPTDDHTPYNWSAQIENGKFKNKGSYFPPKLRYIDPNNASNNKLHWGDAGEHMAFYLMMLATEYRLLKDYGQSTESTRNELLNVMYAIERLDMYAERFVRERGGCGDVLGLHTYDVNGYMLRDDVDRDITTKNPLWTGSINIIDSDYISNEDKRMSQDHFWHLLVALALVKKLVDEPGTYNTLKNESNTISKWASNMGQRLIAAMHGHIMTGTYVEKCKCRGTKWGNTWIIRDPYNCDVPKVSQWLDIKPYSKYFSKAGKFFKGEEMTWGDPTGARIDKGDPHFKACGKLSLSAISNWYPDWEVFDYCDYLDFDCYVDIMSWYIDFCTHEENYPGLKYGFEHLPLVYWILHRGGSSVYETIGETADKGFYEHVVDLLNTAPDCGPYNYGSYEQILSNSTPDWASQVRLAKPHQTVEAKIKKEAGIGDYHGLDYMVLHNLYWLTVIDRYTLNKYVSFNYPTFAISFVGGVGIGALEVGTKDNPATVTAQNKIVATNTIASNAHVTLNAGSVEMYPNFSAETGSDFTANATHSISGQEVYSKRNYQPNCTGWPHAMTTKSAVTTDNSLIENQHNAEKDNYVRAEHSVYPNPAEAFVNINFKAEQGYIKLYNFEGKLVKERLVEKGDNTLNMNTLKNGIYILHVHDGKHTTTFKVVKR